MNLVLGLVVSFCILGMFWSGFRKYRAKKRTERFKLNKAEDTRWLEQELKKGKFCLLVMTKTAKFKSEPFEPNLWHWGATDRCTSLNFAEARALEIVRGDSYRHWTNEFIPHHQIEKVTIVAEV